MGSIQMNRHWMRSETFFSVDTLLSRQRLNRWFVLQTPTNDKVFIKDDKIFDKINKP